MVAHGVQGVELAGAAERKHEKQRAKRAAEHCGSHDAACHRRRAVELVAVVIAVVSAVAHPLLEDAAAVVAEERAVGRVASPRVAVELVGLVDTLVEKML